MEVYELDVEQFISREICDRAMGGEKVILAFPCFLMHICLEAGFPKLPDTDQYIEMNTTTDLGFIRDAVNP